MKSTGIKVAVGMMLAGLVGLASAATPVGVWKTIDDKTGKERSIVRITEVDGQLQGVVEQLFDFPGDDPKHLCDKCKGERKDKPIVGMTILWGLTQHGEEWSGGEILDPKNGKIYRCKMTPSADGKQLNVRGFIGVSLIGRSQIWHRVQ
jgi:uncharacterized protein (DUF2147 family)